jgi:DNA-binding winged helix-turn-helix (wHTH) protein
MYQRVHFDEWTFDGDARELVRRSRRVHLSPKAFDLLGLLIASRPRVVSKDEIQDHLWPKTFVSESNLAGLVKEIRAALAEDARAPRYVRTVHRFGYAFSGTAVEAAGAATATPSRNRLVWGSREVTLCEGENVLGRASDAAAWIDSTSVSRHHARILVEGARATLEDLGSKNGTWLRGQRLSAPTLLADGDEIRVGSVRLTFHVLAGEASTDTHSG